MQLRYKLLIGAGVTAAVVLTGMVVAGQRLARRFEPFVQEQARLYLSRRFNSEVEIGSLKMAIPQLPPLRLFLSKGRGVVAEVRGEKIILRHKGRRDIDPMFTIQSLHFQVDLGRLFEPRKHVAVVNLDGMKIVVPPKGERPSFSKPSPVGSPAPPEPEEPSLLPMPSIPTAKDFLIERVIITNSALTILPRDPSRKPLEFALHRLALDSVQMSESMNYNSELTIPKPPGQVKSTGKFGPWDADTPSDTLLAGVYEFSKADLGHFRPIAGTLESKGKFAGTLGRIAASGEATVPNFQLRKAGHPLPLYTKFEAVIDGTNGNTILKPVQARLRNTHFTTAGGVIKHDGDTRRSIDLAVFMPAGHLTDLLTLAMRAPPPMSGRIKLNAIVKLPPEQGRVVDRLELDGTFSIERGQFLRPGVQDKVDTLSRRAQGQPKNEEIDSVFSRMTGSFNMDEQEIVFKTVTFRVPGAAVEMAGRYALDDDVIDFAGTLRLDATVSQTMSGWKRWVLKPVDPLFRRHGAGTFVKIKVSGSSKSPQFSGSR